MTPHIAGSAIGTLIAVGFVFGAARLFGPLPLSISQVTTNKQSSFDVTGEGKVATAPDRAEVNLGISTSESTVKAAQDKGNQAINAITKELTSMGIDRKDIKTSGYSLYPTYDFRAGTQKITGYSLNVNLLVKVEDFSKVNDVVDSATRNGANQIGGISFTLSDEKKKEVEDQVREAAVQEAKAKAESLARLSGVRLGRIINVSENTGGDYPRPYPAMMEKAVALDAGAGGAGAPTNVEPGSTTFTMTITLSYETL